METKTESLAVPEHPELSLIRGGPFYRAQQATRLIHPDEWNLGRRITFAIAVGWVPLVLMRILFNHGDLINALKDYTVNSRMLVAVPVLLLAQPFMESRFRMVVEHIRVAHLLEGADLARLNEIIATLTSLRDSVLPELIILLLIAVHTIASYKGQVVDAPWLAQRIGADLRLTPEGWYAVLVSATIFQFLLGLNLWKWLLWTFFAFRLSRLDLKLIPSHPDEHGGIGFLGLTPAAFGPIAFAAAIVIGASFRHRILYDGAHLVSFKWPGVLFAVIIALIALGPLFFFCPRLIALRRKGILQYAIIGQMQSRDFHNKWVLHAHEHEAELIDAPEVSTLCDYNSVFSNVARLRPFPADKDAFTALAISVLVPALPTVLAEIPFAEVVKTLLGALK